MPYLIDGHNLIPKIPGIHLRDLDDEERLIQMLQEYCRIRRRQVEVYFDNAPVGQVAVRKYGAVKAYFVRQGRTADCAIQDRLLRLGKAAQNWTVVSSDRAVQASARSCHAAVVSSDEFAREITAVQENASLDLGQQDEPEIGPGELDDWLSLFGTKGSSR
jgi:predicted RNA-binding protein with PIN domain